MSGQTTGQRPGPCLVINQHQIDAPGFPRPQGWWDHFMPHDWTRATVQPDGLVLIDVATQPRTRPHPDNVKRRNQERALIELLARIPQLEVAIVEDADWRCRARMPDERTRGHG
jgi:hypothetical protein